MGKLYLTTGLGHCGTAWLANVLDYPAQGLLSIHEAVKGWVGKPWKEGVLHYLAHGIDSYFDPYFEKLRSSLEAYPFVVDSHSWIPTAIPKVDARIQVFMVIHLIRNGLRNVASLYQTYQGAEALWADRVIQRELGEVNPQLLDGTLSWEWWCHWWAANQDTVNWMRRQGLRVVTLRLEALTEDLGVLSGLLRSFNVNVDLAELREEQKIRRHVHVEWKPLNEVWSSLSPNQRDSFTRICASGMEHYGYGIG